MTKPNRSLILPNLLPSLLSGVLSALLFAAPIVVTLPATAAYADPPKIVAVKAKRSGMGWRIDVTLEHADTGWDHYADGWQVYDADGKVLGDRELMHPHVDEQPFTRSLSSVMVPDGTKVIYIRARCNTDGWHDEVYAVNLRY